MHPLVNDAYTTLKPYVPGKPVSETERELGISNCVKLASNENPYGPSPLAMAAVQNMLGELHDYPDGGAFALKRRLATFHNVKDEQIIVGNGSNEIIEMLLRTCLRPDEHMLFANPSFIAYKLCALAMGAKVVDVPLANMRYDLPALVRAANEQTKVVFVANPNNPTGTYVTRTELEAFLQAMPAHVLVVLDEAYVEYAVAEDYPNGLDCLGQRERLMVLRTFSKCYGLAGLRVGYGVGSVELVDYLNRGRQPFNVSSVAQAAAVAALDDVKHVQRTRRLNHAAMKDLVTALEERGFAVVPSQANFVLVDFHRDAKVLFDQLLRRGVIVRPMDGYALPTMARVTVGTLEQNARLITALDALLR